MKINTFFSSLFLFLVLIFIGVNFQNCNKTEDAPDPLVEDVKQIAREASVMVFSNYRLKHQEANLWLTPEGEITENVSKSKPFGSSGTGTIITDGNSFRVLTARHVVDASVRSLIEREEKVIQGLFSFFITNGWPEALLLDQNGNIDSEEVINLAEDVFEVDPMNVPGHIVLPNTSEVEYLDELAQNPNRTPKVAIPYSRSQLGTINDYAILKPDFYQLREKWPAKKAIPMKYLATQESLDSIYKSSTRASTAFGFPSQYDRLSFEPQEGTGVLTEFDGEELRLTFDNNVRPGSSGSIVICNNSVIGIVSRYTDQEGRAIVAVPINIALFKLEKELSKD